MNRPIEIEQPVVGPQQKIAGALEKLSQPWREAGQSTPTFQAIEIARETNLGVSTIINALSRNESIVADVAAIPTTIFVADKDGNRVNGNIKDVVKNAAPMKRVIKASRFESREPSSKNQDVRRKKPVIKSKLIKSQIDGKTADFGKKRLAIRMEPFTEYDLGKRIEAIKFLQAKRAMKKYGIILPDVETTLSPEEEQEKLAQQDVAYAMQYFNAVQTAKPAREEEAKKRFLESRFTNDVVNLFVPWGVRPEGEPILETGILDTYQSLKEILQNKGINAQIFIMPADIYVTEVNNAVDPESAARYFKYIKEQSTLRDFMVKPWSEIRNENMQRYQQIASQLDDKTIVSVVENPTIIQKAFASAKRRSGNFTNRSIQASAFAYLRERICEGIIIEELYKPIKVGLAPKFKDDYIDGNLPRIYVFPTDKQLPWLK